MALDGSNFGLAACWTRAAAPPRRAIATRNQGRDDTSSINHDVLAGAVIETGPGLDHATGFAVEYLLTVCVYGLCNRGFRNSYRDA
ncbi:MAG: hypothetical protein V4517_18980 [Pseudomonadota bacterium]